MIFMIVIKEAVDSSKFESLTDTCFVNKVGQANNRLAVFFYISIVRVLD